MTSRTLTFLAESTSATWSQVMFSAAGLATTAAVTREASVTLAAGVFALYALQSVVLSAMRGYLVQSPLLRHSGGVLCEDDVRSSLRTTLVVAFLWLLPTGILGRLLGLPWTWTAAAMAWIFGVTIADVLRMQVVALADPRRANKWITAYAVCVVALSLTVSRNGLPLLLILAGVLSLPLAVALHGNLVRASTGGVGCRFWRVQRSFAIAQVVEATGFTAIASLVSIAIATLSPPAIVALQVSQQAVVNPALLVANSAGVIFTRRAVARQQTGRSDLLPLAVWMGSLLPLMMLAWICAIVADPLLAAFFGKGWDLGRPIIPWLALHGACFTAATVALVHYRPIIPPRTVAASYILGTALNQAVLLVVVATQDLPGLPLALLLSSLLQVVYWPVLFGRWSLRRRKREDLGA
jgi:hypothetical protein